MPVSLAADGTLRTGPVDSSEGEIIEVFDSKTRTHRAIPASPSFAEAFRQCGLTVARKTVLKLADDYGEGSAMTNIVGCHAVGEGSGILTLYTSGSGGNFRQDLLLDPDAVGFSTDSGSKPYQDLSETFQQTATGTQTYLNGELRGDYETSAQVWADLHGETAGIASGRHIVVFPSLGDTAEWSAPTPIAFAAFLSDGSVFFAEGDASARIVRPARAFAYDRSRGDPPANDDWCLRTNGLASTSPISLPPANATLSAGDGELRVQFASGKTMTLPSGGCSTVSADRRYLVQQVGEEDNSYSLMDVSRLRYGATAAKIADLTASHFAGVRFVPGSDDVLLIRANDVVLLSAGKHFAESRLYRGSRIVVDAELSLDRKNLLVTEDFSGGYVGGLVYSVDSQRVWRRLGTDYKWYAAKFTGPRDISLSSERVGFHVHLHTFAEAVAAARNALNKRCAAAEANDYRSSPCWPSGL